MEADGDAFWFQPPAAPRRRRTQTAPLLNPVALILAIPILALLVLFFVLPPFLAHTNQILRPNSVKKGWDSINVVLVLFAILCGVFARRNDEAPPSEEVVVADERRVPATDSTASNFVNRPRQSVPEWMDFPDRREYSSISSGGAGGGGLRRSSSSYPDLRQESVWESEGGNRSRFFDDFEVNFYRSPPSENFELRRRRSHEAEAREAEAVVREIQVDKFEVSSVPPVPAAAAAPLPESSTPPTPPPPPPTLKRRRPVRSVPRAEIVDTRKDKADVSQHRRQLPPPAPPPPPSPPPPPAAAEEVPSPEEVSVKIHRRKSGTKEFANAITSLYKGQRKRKKRGKSRNIYENAEEHSSPPSAAEPPSAPPPPPPPPPPAPPKVLQNPFKKSGKSKRVHSVPTAAAPPPPPPPPPPNSIFNNLFKTGNRSKRFLQSSAAPPAPPPPPPPPSSILSTIFKTGSKSRRHKNVTTTPPPSPPPPPPPPGPAEPPRRRHTNTGKPPKPTKPAEHYHESATVAPPSPLIPLPPPPPPFRMPEVRFVARGDFVRIRSTHSSSRGSSPDLEDDDIVSVKSEGGDSIGPSVSCPSPDVNAKADSFIARLRDEWRLEKMNSAREKRISG